MLLQYRLRGEMTFDLIAAMNGSLSGLVAVSFYGLSTPSLKGTLSHLEVHLSSQPARSLLVVPLWSLGPPLWLDCVLDVFTFLDQMHLSA